MIVAGLLLALAAAADSLHGSVVTDTLWSQALGAKKAVVVYLPPSYASSPRRRYPVAYYLHGFGGAETDWTRLGQLDVVMDSLVAAGGPEMIVVMPDGDDSWYTTWNALVTFDACRKTAPQRESAGTYCVPWQHYDDYVARDLVQFADRKYRTRADRAHRAIAGLSMGGYGALALSLEYPEVWAAAASHSGVVSPLYMGPAPGDTAQSGRGAFAGHPRWAADRADLEAASGKTFWPGLSVAFGRDTAAWWSRDPGRRLERLVAGKGTAAVPALFADCGTGDGFLNQNRAFRWKTEQVGVPLVYHEWPGKHDWPYWRAHVGESLAWIGARIGR